MSNAATHDHHDDHHGAPKGFFQRWCMSTNHKDIGTLYLIFALTMFFIGGSFAMAIRAELFQPRRHVSAEAALRRLRIVVALAGDRFSAADLTFASLATPALMPPGRRLGAICSRSPTEISRRGASAPDSRARTKPASCFSTALSFHQIDGLAAM